MMRAAICLLILAACSVKTSQGACTKDHPKVGLSAELSTLEHDVEGTVVVVDDCSFRVDDFKYDGTGPDVFWYAADTEENLESGFIMDSIPRSDGVWDGTREVTITLPEGTTWDDVNVISVWCRQFSINFGFAELPEAEPLDEEDPPKVKVTLTATEQKAPVDKELAEATEKVGSLSGGSSSLGSFSGGSTSSVSSSESTGSFVGGSSSVSIRGSSTASAGGSTELKQSEKQAKESPDVSDEFAIDQEDSENGSATVGMSLLSLLGTLMACFFF